MNCLKRGLVMFLHIGGSRIVFLNNLIGIFKIDLAEGHDNKVYLSTNKSDVTKVCSNSEQSKSFIVTDDNIYLSPISPLTLSRRRNSSSRDK